MKEKPEIQEPKPESEDKIAEHLDKFLNDRLSEEVFHLYPILAMGNEGVDAEKLGFQMTLKILDEAFSQKLAKNRQEFVEHPKWKEVAEMTMALVRALEPEREIRVKEYKENKRIWKDGKYQEQ